MHRRSEIHNINFVLITGTYRKFKLLGMNLRAHTVSAPPPATRRPRHPPASPGGRGVSGGHAPPQLSPPTILGWPAGMKKI